MLEKVKNRADAKVQHAGSPDGDLINLELRSLLGFLRRHLVFMVAVVIVCLSVGVAYLLTTPPKFTASASVIIDARRTTPCSSNSLDIQRA